MQSKIIEIILTENSELLQEIINIVKDNDVFNNVMNDLKEQYFIDDAIHGISHNERVALLACYIGIKEGLNNEELRLVLEASKYHDIGRGFEGNHGQASTSIIDRNRDHIFPNLKDNEVNIVKALCHGHSVDDKEYKEIAKLYGIENIKQFKKLLNIVKDADALDRVRLHRFGQLDEKYLRTEISKEMIDVSKELFRKYREIQRELENNNSKENVETSSYEFNEGLREGLLFDGENYYLIRSLNKNDLESLNNGRGIVPKIDNEDEYSVQDIISQIRMQHRKTSLISMSEDPNIALTYDRTNLHRFVLIRLSKDEIKNHQKVFSAGEYLLGVMDKKIKNATKNTPENVRNILERVDSASSIDEIIRIINGADRQVPTSLLETEQQYLTPEEQLAQSKKIAKCKVLNYYGLMRNITYDEKEKPIDISGFTQIMRNGYSSSEWLYSGEIDQEKIINIPPILVDSLALIKQAEFQGKDRETLKRVEQEILSLAISGRELNQDNYQLEYTSHENMRSDLTIDKAYEITNGQISYRDTNMQMTAIRSLAEMTLNKRKIVELLQERFPDIDINELLSDTYCINQEMVTRQNNRGSQIGKHISFIISDYGYDFDDKISEQILQNVESLSNEHLVNIIEQGVNAQEIGDLLIKTRQVDERIQTNKSKRLGAKYIAEAIVEGYNWRQNGISLTKQEKTLVANTLLKGLATNNELYVLYEAINKMQIEGKKFTQNEIFAIMINLAIDNKIGDISYSELLKKDISEIQNILSGNKELLQTSVLLISIDLLAGHGREINRLKKELIDIGLDKEFIELKDERNLYVAKQIVDEYNFRRKLTPDESKAILRTILNKTKLNKNGHGLLSTLIQNMEQIGLDTQQIYGMIINLGINGKVIKEIGYDYTRLLANKNNACQTIAQYKDKIQTDITEGTILKAKANNLSLEDVDKLKKELIAIGLDKDFIELKNESNLYVAKQIIEGYDFERKLTPNESKAILRAILNNTNFNKNRHYLLSTLIQNMEQIGLDTQQIYGMIINLGINGKVIKEIGYDYTSLLANKNNACQTIAQYKDEIQTDITEGTILKAREDSLSREDVDKLKKELIDLGLDKEVIELKNKSNLYVAKQIVDEYNFRRKLTSDESKAILRAILNNTQLNNNKLSKLIQNMEQIGLDTQQIYGMIINLGINGKVIKKIGYDYTSLLTNNNNACQTIAQHKDKIQTDITEGTILKAKADNLSLEDVDKLKKELIDIGLDKEFIELKDERNLYVAKQIVDEYNFRRKLTPDESKAILRAILNNTKLNNNKKLSKLIQNMEQIGLDTQQIYGMIINLGINGKVIEETGYDYTRLLTNNNNACKTIAQYKDEINIQVTEETIQKARKSKKVRGQDIAKATIELTIEGGAGSEICDLVQADYQRLLNEKTKENKKDF